MRNERLDECTERLRAVVETAGRNDDRDSAPIDELCDRLIEACSLVECAVDDCRNGDRGIAGCRLALAACARLVDIAGDKRRCPQCAGMEWAWLERMLDGGAPRTVVREWVRWFLAHARQHHPHPLPLRAAALMRSQPASGWTLARLATACNTSPSRIRRSFVARFGLSPLSYLQVLRARDAVRRSSRGEKVESLALDVGYRSKKDLYVALDRWTGRTPGELGRLSDEARSRIVLRLEALLEERGRASRTTGDEATSTSRCVSSGDRAGVGGRESSTLPM